MEIRICTADNPYDKDNPDHDCRWQHPDAEEVGEQRSGWPSGDLQSYLCPHCGLKFTVELPQ